MLNMLERSQQLVQPLLGEARSCKMALFQSLDSEAISPKDSADRDVLISLSSTIKPILCVPQ